jgi:PAS domain S-box-containing protein
MDDMFRLAVEACPAAMILVDDGGIIRLVNEECERLFGYGRGHLVGASIDILVPIGARDGHRARRASFEGQPSKRRMGMGRDLRATRADGREFPVEIGLTPIVGVGVLAFVVDISARVEAERAIRGYTEQLEQANENLARFAHVASHDIQEPLRKIVAFADMLKGALAASDTTEATYAADVMAESARRARRLVQDVLTLATLHETRLERREVRLSAIVDEVLGALSQTIAEEGARVEVDVGETAVDADPAKAERLLANLVANALKYHRPGEPAVVRITGRRETDGAAHLVVADEGVGFPAQRAGEIFAPFKRLHRREDYPGTGIGLAIVKSIADEHGWSIAVEAAEGKGARFDVRLGSPADGAGGRGGG